MFALLVIILFIVMAARIYLAVYNLMWRDREIDLPEAPSAGKSDRIRRDRPATNAPTIPRKLHRQTAD